MLSRSTTIAIVDDDISFREALEGLVSSLGFEVLSYSSPDAFLKAPQRADADCFVIDVQMPGMSGLELQARLAADGCTTPVIFITSHADDAIRSRALRAGAVAFLHKPFGRDEFLQQIRSALGTRH